MRRLRPPRVLLPVVLLEFLGFFLLNFIDKDNYYYAFRVHKLLAVGVFGFLNREDSRDQEIIRLVSTAEIRQVVEIIESN